MPRIIFRRKMSFSTNNHINSDSKKLRSFLALLFTAGDVRRYIAGDRYMKYLVATLMLTYSIVANAYKPDEAKSNLASEFSTCSAYYSLMSHALKRENKDSTTFDQSGYLAYSLASKLSNENTTKARMELDMKQMMKEINSDWSNGAILINKYAEHCKNIIENSEARMQYWLDK